VVFRVSRIAAATVLDEPGQRPPAFDLPAFWTAWCAAFLASVPRYPTTLRATPAAARMLGRRFARGVPPPPPGEPEADGRVTLEIDLETLEVACSSVLGVGPEAEVLAPPELRAEVIARLAAASARYAPPAAAPGGAGGPAPLP
jgi:predicted DNA-binding transcriptional regulator YafY